MDQSVGTNHNRKQQSGDGPEQGTGARSSFRKMPITLSKSELAQILDCWIPGRGEPNYRKLKKKFFTPEVMARIGITDEQYLGLVEFDRLTTIKIIEVLQIENEAHEYAKDRL